MSIERITHLIGGTPWTGVSERTSKVYNPATGEVTGELDLASAATVDEVVKVAHDASKAWGRTSLTKRALVLFKFRELLNERKEELAALITAEHGKVLSDALGEVTRGLEVVEFACGIPHLMKGGFSENVSTNVDVYSIRQSLGAVAVISPFNFPAMVPLWFVPIAVATGNSVVIKPSEKDPSAVNAVASLWKEAGLPDADLDLAADAAVNAGFGSAGERCMAISALIAVEPVADQLIGKIRERMATLKTGDGTRGCDMGPLVTGPHRDKVVGYVEAGVSAGAELAVDGREGPFDGADDGFWLGPTLFDKVTPDMSIYTDEIFGPVLSVVRVPSYDAALDLVNSNPYGNGTAIFTNDGGAARRYQTEVEVGMVGVNVPIPVPMAYYSFGGWKNSLFGDTHAHGTEGVHFFTRGKVVTSRWLDPRHGGVNLGFPTQT